MKLSESGIQLRRKMRFSLRFLLSVMFSCAVAAIWIGSIKNRELERQSLIELMETSGARVTFNLESPEYDPHGPVWLRKIVGEYAFTEIDSVLAGRELTEDQIASVLKFPELNYLEIAGNKNASDQTLARISQCKKLRTLNLCNTNLSDEAFTAICESNTLRRLNVRGTQVSDIGLTRIVKCTSLELLNLGYTQVTSDGFQSIGGCSSLRALNIDGITIDALALVHLQKLPNLESLSVCDTNLSDDHVSALTSLKSLTVIYVNNTSISDEGKLRLRKQMPGLTVSTHNM